VSWIILGYPTQNKRQWRPLKVIKPYKEGIFLKPKGHLIYLVTTQVRRGKGTEPLKKSSRGTEAQRHRGSHFATLDLCAYLNGYEKIIIDRQ